MRVSNNSFNNTIFIFGLTNLLIPSGKEVYLLAVLYGIGADSWAGYGPTCADWTP